MLDQSKLVCFCCWYVDEDIFIRIDQERQCCSPSSRILSLGKYPLSFSPMLSVAILHSKEKKRSMSVSVEIKRCEWKGCQEGVKERRDNTEESVIPYYTRRSLSRLRYKDVEPEKTFKDQRLYL